MMAQFEMTNKTFGCVTIYVKIKKSPLFDLRLWIGCRLIMLGARIAGFSYDESETE